MEGDSRNPRVSLLKKYDIPIDHLSFEYIETCRDKKELERIVRILRSGEEGSYPDLLKTAENQLRGISPESRVLRVEAPVLRKESFSNEEWQELEKELLSWEQEMNVMDKSLEFEKQRLDTIGNKNLPEVRRAIEKKPENKMKKEAEIKKVKIETNTKNERIKSGDYAAWDKFDVDKELLKIDLEDERNEEKNAKIKREMEKRNKKMEEEKKIVDHVNIDADSYSNMEQQILANQAKDRGNECFKSGDYDNALKYYSLSLKLCATANAYNNRAMTYIKLKDYEQALMDCNEVLKREQNNVKALHRRATAYQSLPGENNDVSALKDLLKIISLEPTNRVAQADIQMLKKKLNVQDLGRKFRMMIEDSDDGGMKSNSSNRSYMHNSDNITAVNKLPLTYYGPSTSRFQCEPQSMTHRMLSGPTFSGEVMCKCNSNATRQNPLCHRCGERLSRPKPKSKLTVQSAAGNPPKEKTEVNSKNEGIKQGEKSATGVKAAEKSKPEGEEKSCKNSDGNAEAARDEGGKNSTRIECDEKPEVTSSETKGEGDKERKVRVDADAVNGSESKVDLDEASSEKSKEVECDEEGGELPRPPSPTAAKRPRGEPEEAASQPRESGESSNTGQNSNEAPADNCGAEQEEKEGDRNRKLFQELDRSIKERKNMDNAQCKESKGSQNLLDRKGSGGDREKSRDKSEGSPSDNDNVQNSVNTIKEASDRKSANDNDNQCLPSTSSQTEIKSESKRSRSKRKVSKEPRQDGIRLRYFEPVKIVQAPKYLKPTSAEPKPEVLDSSKGNHKDSGSESKCQFKSFVPSKKYLSTESGVLKSTSPSHCGNVKDRDHRGGSSQLYSSGGGGAAAEKSGRLSNCEGNKENILENGNDRKPPENAKNESSQLLESSFEFIKSWESMKKSDESYEKRAEIIRLVRPEDLKTVIGNNLDSDMLKSLLECLEKHFLESDPKKVTSILKELPGIPRFDIVNLFLDVNERKVIERLIESTEKKGFVLDDEVKNSFKIAF